MGDNMAKYVVTSKVKELVKSLGMASSSDFVDRLDSKVEALVKDAVSRAKANNRKTVRPHDI